MQRLICVFLSCFISLSAKPLKIDVASPTAILMNLDTGAILYEKNIHQRHYPASITKIATALYVLEKMGDKLEDCVVATPHALSIVHASLRQAPGSKHPSYRLEHDGTMMGIKPGEHLTLKTLLYGLMLSSGNDAGNVLAEAMSGSIDQFIAELNDFLLKKGIKETHFTNPHGLHHHEHWTTAYDMAQMTRIAMCHPTFREIVKTAQYEKPTSNKQPARILNQHNRLVKPGRHFYSKAIGVKTGYVSKAGHTFVGAAQHEGRTLIAVLLNCAESEHRFKDSIKLFEAAFAEKQVSRTLFAKESDCFTRVIRSSKSPLKAVLKEDLVLKYYPAEEPAFRAEIHWSNTLLPIHAGDAVGHLRLVSDAGDVINELVLHASTDLKKKAWVKLVDFCSEYRNVFVGVFLSAQVFLLLFYFFEKDKKVPK